MLPSTLHYPQGGFVRLVTARDHFSQMAILCLYDIISGVSLVSEIT